MTNYTTPQSKRHLLDEIKRFRFPNDSLSYNKEFGEFIRNVINDKNCPLELRVTAWLEYNTYDYRPDQECEKMMPNDDDVAVSLIDFIHSIITNHNNELLNRCMSCEGIIDKPIVQCGCCAGIADNNSQTL